MTSRFPRPSRTVEIPNEFPDQDAIERRLERFLRPGRPGHAEGASFLIIDETRQIAVDFAKQAELLKRTSGRSEAATCPEDDKLAKLGRSCSPEEAPETRRLPRAAKLPPLVGLPMVEAPTQSPNAISFESDGLWMSTPLLHRPSDPFSSRTKFLIAIAVATLLAGYFDLGDSDRPIDVAVVPQTTSEISPVQFLSSRGGQIAAAAAPSTDVENRIEPEAQTTLLQPTTRSDIKSIESEVEAIPAQTLQPNSRPKKYKRKYKRGLRSREVRKGSGNIRQ